MIIKWIAEYYIKQACKNACNGSFKDYTDIQTLLFSEIRSCDTESNDSTIYAFMLEQFNKSSNLVLHYVSKGLRK